MNQTLTLPNVLTLEETADYLRLPKETVERQARRGQIPGRRIEDTWRFLRDAIDDWLRSQDSRAILLQQAGALAEDDTLAELRAAIYTARGRPEAATGMIRFGSSSDTGHA
jgi:excisionase family DNA binding protein